MLNLKKPLRRLGPMCLALAGALVIGLAPTANAEDLRLKIAGTLPLEHQGTKILEQIADEIEAADVGLKVSVFPANQLGSGEELLEDAIRGNVDIVMGFIYANKDPLFEINSIPYLVSSWDDMEATVRNPDSAFNQIMGEGLAKLSLRMLANNPEGFSNLVSEKRPDDFAGLGPKGMLSRVWSSNAVNDTMKAIGYNTTTIAYAEIFAAVQSGVVDGAICCTKQSADKIFAKSGVGKYFVEYNAFMELSTFYASEKTWEKMTEEQREVVQAAVNKAADDFFAWNKENDAKYEAELISKGYEILTPTKEELDVLSAHVREVVWPSIAEAAGQDAIDRLKADLNGGS